MSSTLRKMYKLKELKRVCRLNGEVSFYKNNDGDIDTVPGPYKKEKRLKILEKVFKAEVQIAQHFAGGDESKAINLISHEKMKR